MTNFTLTEEQEIKLNDWKETIKKLYGSYGLYEYIFIPDSIGISIKVKSRLCSLVLDLTDVDNF